MQNNGHKKAACEKDRFHIEVTGINHGDEHQIRFYDTLDKKAKSGIEATKQTLVLDETTIYDWDWTGEVSNNVWLEVKTEKGEPIKLPLFRSAYQTKRKENQEQDYLLHACLPSLFMQSVDAEYKLDHIVPPRGGFIYIAYKAPYGSNFQLWREIEIFPGAQDSFKDINLQSFRETPVDHLTWADALKSNPIKNEKREPTGVPLKEIWIPGKKNGSKLSGSVLIAFSEVQWSAARINYLEANQDQLKERMKRVKISKITKLPEMRKRAPELEMLVSDAVALTRDIKGTFLKERYDIVKNEQKLLADDTEHVSTAFGDLRCKADYALRATACAVTNNKEPLFPEDFWQSESESDYWAEAKNNHLRTFTAEDPVFEARNHAYLLQSASAYFQQVKELSEAKDHYLSAELISRLILAKQHNGQRNELSKYRKHMDLSSNSTFHRTLRTAERSQYTKQVPSMQYGLSKLLSDKILVQSVRDMGALDGVNAAGSHLFCCSAINALLIDAEMDNPLISADERKKHAATSTLIALLEKDGSHPLNPVLFDRNNKVPLDAAYIPPAPKNDGSGLASEANLARWNEKNLNLDEELVSLDAGLLYTLDDRDAAPDILRRAALFGDLVAGIYMNAVLKIVNSPNIVNSVRAEQFDKIFTNSFSFMKATLNETLKELRFGEISNLDPTKHLVIAVKGDGLNWGLTDTERTEYQKKQQAAFKMHDPRTGNSISLNTDHKAIKAELDEKRGVYGLKNLKVLHVPQSSLSDQQRIELSRGFRVDNGYRTYKVPYFITALELFNLQRTFQNFNFDNKTYSTLNTLSAAFDLSVASLNAINFLSNDKYFKGTLKTRALPKNLNKALSRFSHKLGNTFVTKVTGLVIAGIYAGIFTAAMGFWESINLLTKLDYDAALAMGVAATGLLITSFYHLTPLTSLGPIGWLIIAATIISFVTAILLTDDDIEVWLKNGPFGQKSKNKAKEISNPDFLDSVGNILFNSNAYDDLLTDPNFAWYQLINTLLNIQARVEPFAKGELEEEKYKLLKSQGIDTQVVIQGNIQGLLSSSENMPRYQLELNEIEIKRQYGGSNMLGGHPVKTGNMFKGKTLYSLTTENGIIHYLRSATGKSHFSAAQKITAQTYSEWQLRLKLTVGEFTFPAPEMDKGKKALDKIDELPDFNDSDQLGWLSEFRQGNATL